MSESLRCSQTSVTSAGLAVLLEAAETFITSGVNTCGHCSVSELLWNITVHLAVKELMTPADRQFGLVSLIA